MPPFSPVADFILIFENDGLSGAALIHDSGLDTGSLYGGLAHDEIITIPDKEDPVQFHDGSFLAFYPFDFNCLTGADPMLFSSG